MAKWYVLRFLKDFSRYISIKKKLSLCPHETSRDCDMNKLKFTQPVNAFTQVTSFFPNAFLTWFYKNKKYQFIPTQKSNPDFGSTIPLVIMIFTTFDFQLHVCLRMHPYTFQLSWKKGRILNFHNFKSPLPIGDLC